MAAITLSTIVGAGGGSPIKSIQRGRGNSSFALIDVTISAVVLAKSFIRTSFTTDDNNFLSSTTSRLTSTTNLELSRSTTGGSFTVDWEVIEYE